MQGIGGGIDPFKSMIKLIMLLIIILVTFPFYFVFSRSLVMEYFLSMAIVFLCDM